MVDQSGLGQGWVNQGQWAKPGLPHVFINKVYWDLVTPVRLHTIYVSFGLQRQRGVIVTEMTRPAETQILTICPLTESVCQGQTFLLNHPT